MLAHVRYNKLVRLYTPKKVIDIEGSEVDQYKGYIQLENGDTAGPPTLGYRNGNDAIVEAVENLVDETTGTKPTRKLDTGWLMSGGKLQRTVTLVDVSDKEAEAQIDARSLQIASGPLGKLIRAMLVNQLMLANEIQALKGAQPVTAKQFLANLNDVPTITDRQLAEKLKPFLEGLVG